MSASPPPQLTFTLPLHPSTSAPVLTPPPEPERAGWLDAAGASASARTSFAQTRVGTPEPGPAPPSPVPEEVPHAPQATLQFLTVSGARRVMSFDPDAAIGRVKELVWSAWPSGLCVAGFASLLLNMLLYIDWTDERPPAPGYLRILHLGRILNDDDTLSSAYTL
jgi:hypothetical protein